MNNISLSELSEILIEKIQSGGEVSLVPTGVSMWPTIWHKRDTVILKKCDLIRKYGIYLYRRMDGTLVLHRCVKIKDGKCWFCGDNQKKDKIEKNILPEQVIARVAILYRKNRTFNCSSAFLFCSYYLIPMYRAAVSIYKYLLNVWGKLCEKRK